MYVYPRFLLLSAALLVAAAGGCTRWGQRAVHQGHQEVARRMVGAPQVAETTDAGGDAGFGSISSRSPSGRTRVASGALSSSYGSVVRQHCIQAAEIDYVQRYDLVPVVDNRELDVVAGGALALLGGVVILGTKIATRDSIFEPGDPLYEEPGDPTAGYTVGGVMIAGGIGIIGYSFAALPRGQAPAVTSHERRWTETQYVESSGCGLVPGDRAQAPAEENAGDAESRLRKLERLHESGLLSDEEYESKRAELLREL